MWLVIFSLALAATNAVMHPRYTTVEQKNTLFPNAPPSDPKTWALLVAGSNGFSNYRHQADICHAYQVLHENGIPDENIIVMMYDDIANSPDNPTPGIIINYPGGPNVYEGIAKAYTGNEVSSENFLNVLSGNKSAMAGIGSGRVIESGPDDIIFVNFVDHGGPGVLYFPNDELLADRLMKTISKMAASSKFAKMVLYIEACHAGSMFDNLLSDTTNVFVLSAADPFESSYACYFDDKRQTYLADVFSIMWLQDAETESLPTESLHHQFERVRTLTNTSHVEEYGDLDIGSSKLKDVLGFRMKLLGRTRPAPEQMDVADNMDVQVILLDKKLEAEKDPVKNSALKLEKHKLMKNRHMVDNIFKKIVTNISADNTDKKKEVWLSKYGLNWRSFPCYKELYTTFNKTCLSTVQNPYVRVHLQKLINMCSVSWLTTDESIMAITRVCKQFSLPANSRFYSSIH